jgi:L-lactate dehydrogenase complex protein LldG
MRKIGNRVNLHPPTPFKSDRRSGGIYSRTKKNSRVTIPPASAVRFEGARGMSLRRTRKMTSRKKILASIASNKPSLVTLPNVPVFEGDGSIERFKTVLESIGGTAAEINSKADCQEAIDKYYSDLVNIASNIVKANVAVNFDTPKEILEQVDLAVIQGEIGVAENGTIWVPESNMINRALPFITQHLVLVLDKNNIVANMHQAYDKLKSVGSYGVFIAGPSKTADIEQSLVIGAHGARSMMVLIY